MKQLAIFGGCALLVGLAALLLAASPLLILLGKLAIGLAMIALAGIATTYVMVQSFAAHTLRNEDFHWH